jgi:hypothetical protein
MIQKHAIAGSSRTGKQQNKNKQSSLTRDKRQREY